MLGKRNNLHPNARLSYAHKLLLVSSFKTGIVLQTRTYISAWNLFVEIN